MVQNKLYRSFIILQEDERGHSVSNDKPLSGYAKIEAKGDKCKVAFYAQNLKLDYGQCHMVLICSKKDGKYNVDLGPVNITPQGKAEMSLEYDVSNIGDINLSYDKIIGAALSKEMSGKTIYLMYGFLNGEQPKDNWKNYKVTTTKKGDNKKLLSNKDNNDNKVVESKPIENKSDHKAVENKSDHKKHNSDNKKHEENKTSSASNDNKDNKDNIMTNNNKSDNINNENHYSSHYNNKDIDNEREYDNLESKYDDYEREVDKAKNVTDGLDGDDFELRGAMGEFFNGVVEEFEHVRGFSKDIKKCKWYKANVNSFDEMCNMENYNKYTVAYYPMINYYPYIAKHGHFMMGLKGDNNGMVKYVVYGIPGTKDRMDQPYGGKTGFVTWSPNEMDANQGYWLMFYDFQNSVIVVPIK